MPQIPGSTLHRNERGIRALVRSFDRWVSRRRGIQPFSVDERCILRIEKSRSSRQLALPDVVLEKGSPILRLHLWNSHLPQIPPGGTDLAWAAETWHRFQLSLRLLAVYLKDHPEFQSVQALSGTSSLFTPGGKDSGVRLMQRLGFTVIHEPSPLGLLGEFWENLYSLLLVWAYNPTSLPAHPFRRLERTAIWMSVSTLQQGFGEDAPAG